MSMMRADGSKVQQRLQDFAVISGWPTPSGTIVDHKPNPPIMGNRKPTDPQIGLADVAFHLAGWPTPITNDSTGSTHCYSGKNPDGTHKIALKLPGAAQQAGWATPKATDANGAGNSTNRQGGMALHTMAQLSGPARLTASGELLTGLDAGMESGGQLNPAHSRWLQGCPEAWDKCNPSYGDWRKWQDWMQSLSPEQRAIALSGLEGTATPSTRKPRKPLLKA